MGVNDQGETHPSAARPHRSRVKLAEGCCNVDLSSPQVAGPLSWSYSANVFTQTACWDYCQISVLGI